MTWLKVEGADECHINSACISELRTEDSGLYSTDNEEIWEVLAVKMIAHEERTYILFSGTRDKCNEYLADLAKYLSTPGVP